MTDSNKQKPSILETEDLINSSNLSADELEKLKKLKEENNDSPDKKKGIDILHG